MFQLLPPPPPPRSSLSDMESVNPGDERSSQLGNYDPEMEDPSDEDGPPPTKKAKLNLCNRA